VQLAYELFLKDLKQNQLQFFPAKHWVHILKVSMMRFYFLSSRKDKPNVMTHAMPANAPDD
jgi:hypothetical protein